jgi:GNAT superfamily N-acetyltransferase
MNAFITALYVLSKFRNKKIGSHLLEKAIQNLLDEGFVGIQASTANRAREDLAPTFL